MKKIILFSFLLTGISCHVNAGYYGEAFSRWDEHNSIVKKEGSRASGGRYKEEKAPKAIVDNALGKKHLFLQRANMHIEKLYQYALPHAQAFGWLQKTLMEKNERSEAWHQQVLAAIEEGKIHNRASYAKFKKEKKSLVVEKNMDQEGPTEVLQHLQVLLKILPELSQVEVPYGLEVKEAYKIYREFENTLYGYTRKRFVPLEWVIDYDNAIKADLEETGYKAFVEGYIGGDADLVNIVKKMLSQEALKLLSLGYTLAENKDLRSRKD